MTGMTPRIRLLTYITAGAVVVATGVGCGALSTAKKIVGNAQIMANYSDKIQKGLTATYQATYKDAQTGDQVVVQQAPPNSVYVTKTGPWIFNGNTSYLCDNSNGSMVCQKSVYTSTADANAALAGSSIGSGGFMVGELGVGLILAASVVPSAKLTQSTETIAGQKSSCVAVSNLQGSDANAGDTELASFKMCITDAGIVSQFSGTDTSGKTEGSQMVSYSTKIDPSLFQPPTGAQIVDSGSLPTNDAPSTEPSGAPSDSASPAASNS
jgi:hypothetical protein